MDIFLSIKKEITGILSSQLDKKLCYHNVEHSLDVLAQAERIAVAEGIAGTEDILLLKLAALFHDTGFLYTYAGHEEKSCEIAREKLSPHFSPANVDNICRMILATKVPQKPTNLLEQIICDADLDYLGRNDFDVLSNHLKKEFLDFGIVKNEIEWEKKQIAFFEHHHYFTHTSIQKRLPLKMQHLEKLKHELNSGE
jgi:predicted metal-dependent HD superfamily phosphohydrolase